MVPIKFQQLSIFRPHWLDVHDMELYSRLRSPYSDQTLGRRQPETANDITGFCQNVWCYPVVCINWCVFIPYMFENRAFEPKGMTPLQSDGRCMYTSDMSKSMAQSSCMECVSLSAHQLVAYQGQLYLQVPPWFLLYNLFA